MAKKWTHEDIGKDYLCTNWKFTKSCNKTKRDIILDCGLSCSAIYDILLSHKNQGNVDGCFPSYSILMKECNISRPTLTSSLRKLEEYGYIKIKSGSSDNNNKYYFPKDDTNITNYTKDDLIAISSLKRKGNSTNNNVSEKSKENLKNYNKKINDYINPFKENDWHYKIYVLYLF